jgi:hypothetical protein
MFCTVLWFAPTIVVPPYRFSVVVTSSSVTLFPWSYFSLLSHMVLPLYDSGCTGSTQYRLCAVQIVCGGHTVYSVQCIILGHLHLGLLSAMYWSSWGTVSTVALCCSWPPGHTCWRLFWRGMLQMSVKDWLLGHVVGLGVALCYWLF